MKRIEIITKTLTACVIGILVAASVSAVNPTLKYKHAGKLSNWTEESYYNSPVLCDLEGDGQKEIVFSNYSITVLNAATGQLKWRVNSGHDRSSGFAEFGKSVGHTWASAVVKDIDGDSSPEIITGHGNGLVSVLDASGYFKYGWPQLPEAVRGCSVRSIKAEDLDGDGKLEIIAGFGIEGGESVYVFNYDGSIRSGWPQLAPYLDGSVPGSLAKSWSYGVFMNGISAGDIDGDGTKEVIAPTDLSSISAYHHDGSLVYANSEVYGNRAWGNVALYEDYNAEIKGENAIWGWAATWQTQREELYKMEFGHGYSEIIDIDGDGKKEIVITGIMANRWYLENGGYPPTEYMTVSILNSDRTRYNNPALDADWTVLPTDLGAPLVQNPQSVASFVCQKPTISDLDGDGKYEILFSSYNGKVHCFTLDKREPYAWPYSLTKRTSPLYEYATPPACVDIDFDGKKEVIFASFYDETQSLPGIVNGSLYILNYEGKLLSKTTLPPAVESAKKHNGARSELCVDDIDGDGRYEIVINTLQGAVCAYDL